MKMKTPKRVPSRVDHLAALLSEKTGTTFTVLGGRLPAKDFFGRPVLGVKSRGDYRYLLKAERDGHTYVFQQHRPMTGRELIRWLASINDMVNMGFIPVSQQRLQGGD